MKMKITDAAVQAALEYYSEGGCMGLDSYDRKEVATAMIEAALPHLQPVDVAAVTKPVTNIESRTPKEVFDIMCDRIRADLAQGGV